MAKKIVKKVDVKKVAKSEVNSQIMEMLLGLGIEGFDGVDFGMTSGTIIARMEKCDVQIKLITPKAGIDRYESLVEDEEIEEIVQEEEEKLAENKENDGNGTE